MESFLVIKLLVAQSIETGTTSQHIPPLPLAWNQSFIIYEEQKINSITKNKLNMSNHSINVPLKYPYHSNVNRTV